MYTDYVSFRGHKIEAEFIKMQTPLEKNIKMFSEADVNSIWYHCPISHSLVAFHKHRKGAEFLETYKLCQLA